MTAMASYEIWDFETGNVVAWYRTKEEALALVAGYIAQNGREAVATWFLAREDGQDDSETNALIAAGDALANLAMRQHAATAD